MRDESLVEFAAPTPRAGLRAGGRTLCATQRFTEPDRPPRDSSGAADFPRVAGYDLLEVLGYGGMGVVYKARHLRLNRLVALKMIRAGSLAKPEDLARFAIEAEAIARISHPNIIQIYDIGEVGGLPFVALELLEGGKPRGPPGRQVAAGSRSRVEGRHAGAAQSMSRIKPGSSIATSSPLMFCTPATELRRSPTSAWQSGSSRTAARRPARSWARRVIYLPNKLAETPKKPALPPTFTPWVRFCIRW